MNFRDGFASAFDLSLQLYSQSIDKRTLFSMWSGWKIYCYYDTNVVIYINSIYQLIRITRRFLHTQGPESSDFFS